MIKKLIVLFIIVFCIGCASNNNGTNKFSYENDTLEVPIDSSSSKETDNFFVFDINTNIFVGNSLESLEILEVNGSKTAISSNGKVVSYVVEQPQPSSIFLYNIKEKDNKLLNIPTNYVASNPVFSAENNLLAFTITDFYGLSSAALYDLKKDTFKIISKGQSSVFNPTFSPEGGKIAFHNMENVFLMTVSGFSTKVYKTIGCENFCPENYMGIAQNCKFQLSEKYNFILYTYNNYADTVISSVILAKYDLQTGQTQDLSPKNSFCTDFQISQNNQIYFLLRKNADKESESKLYVRDIELEKNMLLSERGLDSPCSFSVSY